MEIESTFGKRGTAPLMDTRRFTPAEVAGTAIVDGDVDVHRGDPFTFHADGHTTKGTVKRRYRLRNRTIKLWLEGMETSV